MIPPKIPGTVILQGTILDETEKALKLDVETVDGEEWTGLQKIYWLPFSQIESDFRSKESGEDWVCISNWLARKVGFK